MSSTIFVLGDPQAEAIALLLRHTPAIGQKFSVRHAGTDVAITPKPGDVVFEQVDLERPKAPRQAKEVRRVTFPAMSFGLLWPLHSVNEFNETDPPHFPHGLFPYGDSFIVSCVEQGVSTDDIIKLYMAQTWPTSWPDLDKLFQQETARLTQLDAKCDVKIGSYTLKHFRRQRLFAAYNCPTNALLGEVTVRLLDAALPALGDHVQKSVDEVRSTFARDILGAVNVPIHPLVAEHFGLLWYDREQRYNFFDQQNLSYREYFEAMIRSGTAARRSRKQRNRTKV